MPEVFELIGICLDTLTLGALVYVVLRIRSRRSLITQAKVEPPENTSVDLALKELLEKSRPSGGRVHIHDVEEVVRRRLG